MTHTQASRGVCVTKVIKRASLLDSGKGGTGRTNWTGVNRTGDARAASSYVEYTVANKRVVSFVVYPVDHMFLPGAHLGSLYAA